MKKLIILLALVLVTVASVTTGILVAQTPSEDDWMVGLPVQNADGTWDPEWTRVSDNTGAIVGVHRTADVMGDREVYPLPVYDKDNTSVQVGWLGDHGYWAIGSEMPWCTDCVAVTEEVVDGVVKLRITDTYNEDRTITRTTETTDDDGNTTTVVQTIEEGTSN